MSNTTYSLVRPTRGLDADPESDLDLDAGPGASSGPRPVSASAAGRAPARDPGSADPTGLAGPARPDGSDGSAERAARVGLDTSSATGWDVEESLEELARLVDTAGGVVVGRVIQRKQKPDPAHFIGAGKAEEISLMAKAVGADLVVFDDELTPVQQRNLEEVIEARVIDRTQLILDIFAQRAATREGKLQVELAQLQYWLPRLTGKGAELSRLGGGIGTRGPGETKLEIDRRTIRSRIASIKRQLETVRQRRGTQRRRRREAEMPVVAMVGYTNAGKSSLLKALPGADAYIEDKLFATLDTTTRRFTLPGGQAVLLTDTVGFIQKLPHQLIMAFRATLEEVTEADVLLHVVDASHPKAAEHCRAVFEVLEELEASEHPTITAFNKVDLPGAQAAVDMLKAEYPRSLAVSALTGTGLQELAEFIEAELAPRRVRMEVALPYDDPLISTIRKRS